MHQGFLDIQSCSHPLSGMAVVDVVAQQNQKHRRQQGCDGAQETTPPAQQSSIPAMCKGQLIRNASCMQCPSRQAWASGLRRAGSARVLADCPSPGNSSDPGPPQRGAVKHAQCRLLGCGVRLHRGRTMALQRLCQQAARAPPRLRIRVRLGLCWGHHVLMLCSNHSPCMTAINTHMQHDSVTSRQRAQSLAHLQSHMSRGACQWHR